MDVYHLTPSFKFVVNALGFIAISIQVGIFINLTQAIACFGFFYLALGTVVFYRGVYMLDKEYIVLNKTGIEYHREDSTLEFSWEDVKSISPRWFVFGIYDSLIIDSSKAKIYRDESRLDTFFSETFIHKSAFKRKHEFIPIACFANHWKDSELGQKINQYAPHLFSNR